MQGGSISARGEDADKSLHLFRTRGYVLLRVRTSVEFDYAVLA